MTDTRQAKAYLWRVRDAERELKRLDKVSNSRIGDLSDAIAALESYAERIAAQWDKLIVLREDAKVRIGQLEDWRYREVLTRRYLQGQSWEQVAVDMGYDYYHVHKLHRRALRIFQEKQSG